MQPSPRALNIVRSFSSAAALQRDPPSHHAPLKGGTGAEVEEGGQGGAVLPRRAETFSGVGRQRQRGSTSFINVNACFLLLIRHAWISSKPLPKPNLIFICNLSVTNPNPYYLTLSLTTYLALLGDPAGKCIR